MYINTSWGAVVVASGRGGTKTAVDWVGESDDFDLFVQWVRFRIQLYSNTITRIIGGIQGGSAYFC